MTHMKSYKTSILVLSLLSSVAIFASAESASAQTTFQPPGTVTPALTEAQKKAIEDAKKKPVVAPVVKPAPPNVVAKPVAPKVVAKPAAPKVVVKPIAVPPKAPVVVQQKVPPKPVARPIPLNVTPPKIIAVPVVKPVTKPVNTPPQVTVNKPAGAAPISGVSGGSTFSVPGAQIKPPVTALKSIADVKSGRVEKVEAGGKRVVIKEADKRTIVKQGGRAVIQKDEAAQVARVAPNATITRGKLGSKVAVVNRAGGSQIVNETDRNGQLIRRFRRDANGNEVNIIDNRTQFQGRKKDHFGRNLAIGLGVGVGVIAGAAILNSVVNDVQRPVVTVPREKYIVRYEDASEDDVYEALNAPPVDTIERHYTLNQVRATPYLRDRMRRVDLDDINFETGSWDVDQGEYRKLERVARAMMRVVERNPNEVFLIEGYTDAVGSDDDNLTLSDRRAETVSVILSEQFQVPFENLTTQGYGEQYLKIDTDGPERTNRRVAVRRITPLLSQKRGESPPPPVAEERRYEQPRYEDRGDDGDSYRRRHPRRHSSGYYYRRPE